MSKINGKIKTTHLLLFLFAIGMFMPTYNNVYSIFLILVLITTLLLKRVKIELPPRYFLAYILIFVSCYYIHYYPQSNTDTVIFIVSTFGVFIILTNTCKNEWNIEFILMLIVKMGTIYALLCIVESFASVNIFDPLIGREPETSLSAIRFGLTRNRGICNNSINNGMLLYHIFGISLFQAFGRKRSTKGGVIRVWIVFVAMILTLGRAVVGVGIMTFIIIVLMQMDDKEKRSRIIKKILFAVPFVLGLLIIIYRFKPEIILQVRDFFMSMTFSSTSYNSQNLGNFSHRILLWTWVYESVRKNIFFGVGFTTEFVHKLTEYTEKTSIEVHWLYILFQRGIYGLIGFIILQIGTLRDYFKARKMKNDRFLLLIKIECVIIPMYFILLFNCSGFEDLRFLYFEIVLLYVIRKCNQNSPIQKRTSI